MESLAYKKMLIKQVNSSPPELRSYIHSLVCGLDASVILDNERLRQENKGLMFAIKLISERPIKHNYKI